MTGYGFPYEEKSSLKTSSFKVYGTNKAVVSESFSLICIPSSLSDRKTAVLFSCLEIKRASDECINVCSHECE